MREGHRFDSCAAHSRRLRLRPDLLRWLVTPSRPSSGKLGLCPNKLYSRATYQMNAEQHSDGAPGASGDKWDRTDTPLPRLVSFLMSVVFGVVGACFGFQLLMLFAFSSLIDPSISGRQWWRIYADRVLFSDGWWQIIQVSVFLFVSVFALVASLLQLACAVVWKPTLRVSLFASSCFAGIATLIIIGTLLILRT